MSYIEATSPDALWRALHAVCLDGKPGCDALTIPHNSNLSGRLMFQPVREDGTPADADGRAPARRSSRSSRSCSTRAIPSASPAPA